MFDTAATYQVTVTDAFGSSVSDATISDRSIAYHAYQPRWLRGQMLTRDAQFLGRVRMEPGQTTQTIAAPRTYVCLSPIAVLPNIKTYFVISIRCRWSTRPDLSLWGSSQTLVRGPGQFLPVEHATNNVSVCIESRVYVDDPVQLLSLGRGAGRSTRYRRAAGSPVHQFSPLDAGNAGALLWNTVPLPDVVIRA
jgi:hypothetical protein